MVKMSLMNSKMTLKMSVLIPKHRPQGSNYEAETPPDISHDYDRCDNSATTPLDRVTAPFPPQCEVRSSSKTWHVTCRLNSLISTVHIRQPPTHSRRPIPQSVVRVVKLRCRRHAIEEVSSRVLLMSIVTVVRSVTSDNQNEMLISKE